VKVQGECSEDFLGRGPKNKVFAPNAVKLGLEFREQDVIILGASSFTQASPRMQSTVRISLNARRLRECPIVKRNEVPRRTAVNS
jgi:hypothetical protein